MENIKSGAVLVDALIDEFECNNPSQLAKMLDVNADQISKWRAKDLTPTTARNIVKRLDARFVRNSFQSICEFRRLAPLKEGKPNTIRNRIQSEHLSAELEKFQGIYTFYDSSGRLIYVGKTEKNTLLKEMGQQFTKRKVRIRKTDNNGHFRHQWVSLCEFVEYCSAYSVHSAVIADFEALIARIAPNDIANDQIPKYKMRKSSS